MVQILLKTSGGLLLGALMLLPQSSLGQEREAEFSLRYRETDQSAGKQKRGTPVHIRVTAVVIDLDKLRELGLSWDLSEEKLADINEKHGGRFHEFVHALANGPAAHMVMAPHLSVIAGQKGSLEVSSWKLEATPKFQENGDIQLELTMDGTLRWPISRSTAAITVLSIRPPDASVEAPLNLTKKVVVRPGEAIFLARPQLEVKPATSAKQPAPDSGRTAKSVEETDAKLALLLFAQVDTKPLDRPNAPTTRPPSLTPAPVPIPIPPMAEY